MPTPFETEKPFKTRQKLIFYNFSFFLLKYEINNKYQEKTDNQTKEKKSNEIVINTSCAIDTACWCNAWECFWWCWAFDDAKLIALARAIVICFIYFGFRALISSKLKSSGGCIIFDVVPADAIIAGGLTTSCAEFDTELLALFVVGGALIVAELFGEWKQTKITQLIWQQK